MTTPPDSDEHREAPEGMVLIPQGSFDMGIPKKDIAHLTRWGEETGAAMIDRLAWIWFGSETPVHRVSVEAFYLDRHQVTNRQYRQFVSETGHKTEGNWDDYAQPDREDHPVVAVSWNDANAYATWAGRRLPTEPEWEYAARGGRDVRWFPWGDELDPSKAAFGRHTGVIGGVLKRVNRAWTMPKTSPVGSYPETGYGLFDMCANVGEWCADQHLPYPGGPQDPDIFAQLRDPSLDIRVIRGGDWNTKIPVFMRITRRAGFAPDTFDYRFGFRCAKSLAEAPEQ